MFHHSGAEGGTSSRTIAGRIAKRAGFNFIKHDHELCVGGCVCKTAGGNQAPASRLAPGTGISAQLCEHFHYRIGEPSCKPVDLSAKPYIFECICMKDAGARSVCAKGRTATPN